MRRDHGKLTETELDGRKPVCAKHVILHDLLMCLCEIGTRDLLKLRNDLSTNAAV